MAAAGAAGRRQHTSQSRPSSAASTAQPAQRSTAQQRRTRVVAAVHIVAHEQVVGVWAGASDAEQLQQVLELAVDVAAHLRRPVVVRHQQV